MITFLVVLKNGSDFLCNGPDIVSALKNLHNGNFDYSFIKSITEVTNKLYKI